MTALIRATLVCQSQNHSRLITLSGNGSHDVAEFAIRNVVERETNSSVIVSRLEDDTCSR